MLCCLRARIIPRVITITRSFKSVQNRTLAPSTPNKESGRNNHSSRPQAAKSDKVAQIDMTNKALENILKMKNILKLNFLLFGLSGMGTILGQQIVLTTCIPVVV